MAKIDALLLRVRYALESIDEEGREELVSSLEVEAAHREAWQELRPGTVHRPGLSKGVH